MAVCAKCLYRIEGDNYKIRKKSYHLNCIDTVDKLIKAFFKLILKDPDEDSIFFESKIPQAKLSNAIKSYATGVSESNVIALYDSTFFGGAEEGLLITKAALYYKEGSKDAISIKFSEMKNVDIRHLVKAKKNFEVLEVAMPNNIIGLNSDDIDLNLGELYTFLKKILEMNIEGKVDETDKYVIIEDMDESVKINYSKTAVNMVFDDDKQIDGKEWSELQLLMTRLNLSPDSRYEIRKYASNPSLSLKELLQEIEKQAIKGSKKSIFISLIKDLVIILRRAKNKSVVSKSVFIKSIVEMTENKSKIIELVQESCDYDEMILQGDVDEKVINACANNLAANASAIGVPIAALYLSGSVVGLSAAGITSGLAALGLGGIFGLSSMITGVGAVVMIGVGAYKGVKWLFESSAEKDEMTSKREFMIQEIFKLHQKAISNMAEDINIIALQVVELARSSEINRNLFEKLGKELTVLAKAHQIIKSRSDVLETGTGLEVLANAA